MTYVKAILLVFLILGGLITFTISTTLIIGDNRYQQIEERI